MSPRMWAVLGVLIVLAILVVTCAPSECELEHWGKHEGASNSDISTLCEAMENHPEFQEGY